MVKKGMGKSLEFRVRHWMKLSSSEGEEAASTGGSKRTRSRTRFDSLEHDIVINIMSWKPTVSLHFIQK